MPVKILIVDDEADFELLVRQRFRREMREGVYEFLFARNGEEALATLHDHPEVEVVLSDINMPVMDGLTLLARLRELKGVPPGAVIVSAYGDMPNIRAAMNQGAFDFLTKPIDFHDFEITVQKTLEMVRHLRAAVAERDRLVVLDRDLFMAAEIQRAFLPAVPPPFAHRIDFAVSATMKPARSVAGDFFDYFLVPGEGGERLGLVVGDVSGKSVPASLLMAVSRTLLRAVALRGTSPGDCLQHVNRMLLRDAPSSLFVTLIYVSLDPRTGMLLYSNGGHNPPLLLRADGNMEILSKGDLIVGFMEEASYATYEARLQPGDQMLLYTDGVTEAMDASRQQFTNARLLDVLKHCGQAGPELVVAAVLDAVERFTSGAPQSDDLTLLALRYNGPTVAEREPGHESLHRDSADVQRRPDPAAGPAR